MQFYEELTIYANFVSATLSITIGLYLLWVWYRQENRINTDLPLLFGVTFLAQAINRIILVLPLLGIEMTMELFRLRVLVVSGSAIPMLAALLQIWFHKRPKQHPRIAFLFLLYWCSVTLLSPTQDLVLVLVTPLILVFGTAMIATFAITWKTGRLQEVRSGLMVIALVIGMGGQVLQVPFTDTSMFFIPDLLTAISLLGITLALTNPWFKRHDIASSDQPQIQYPMQEETSVSW